jgi:hypothetical protein
MIAMRALFCTVDDESEAEGEERSDIRIKKNQKVKSINT